MEDIREVSDAQLVTMIARYNEVALAETYRRHAVRVRSRRRVLNGAAEAEDVTQEVFLRLWNQPERFDATRGTCAVGSSPRATRARSRPFVRSRRDANERSTTRTRPRAAPTTCNTRRGRRVGRGREEGTRGVAAGERRAIELAYFEGYTYIKVAEILNEPEGTVKSRIRNGMRRMRATLVESGSRSGSMMSHDEASELLAVAALHAVDAETLAAIEEHATTCPRCQSELDSYRAVAAAIATRWRNCRGLWTNISSQLWITKVNRRDAGAPHWRDPADVVAIGAPLDRLDE